MHYNILDIARRAGVAKSTVSRVLNDQPHVSEKTREKVYKAIQELDYHPSHSARSIASGKTKTVGLLVPNLTSPFYVEIVEGIVEEINKQEYGLLLYKSEGREKEHLRDFFHKGRTDGIIAITPHLKEQSYVDVFKDNQPFVLINHMNTKIDTPFVCFNNFKGGYMAAQFLINLGHGEIACFTGRLTHQSTLDRSEGFKKALAESGIPVEAVRTVSKGVHFEDSAASIVIDWAKKEKMPSAIFAYNDLLAFEIIGTLIELGFSVPGDVSVLGFDNVRMARYFRPSLTTINQSMDSIGNAGAKMLLSLIQGVTLENNKLTIDPEIIIRDSCDKPNLRRII